MLFANAPSQFVLAWGANAGVGYIRTVPVASQISITAGAASFNDGFVPLNMTPIAAGGVPPFGQDMNGALNVITQWLQYIQAGYVPQYSSTFSGTIGGYPKGALVGSLAGNGALWQSAVDNNTNNPDATPTSWIMATGGLVGATRNLVGQLTGGSATKTATWTCDQICAGTNTGGFGFLGHNLSLSFNGAAATGIGGMDTGVFPAAGNVYIYAMFNPTTATWGLIGTTAGAGATTYGGTATPSGYVASCLIYAGVTLGSNFQNFYQADRTVWVQSIAMLTGGTSTTGLQALSISQIVPPNAKWVAGNWTVSGGGGILLIAGSVNNMGLQTINGSTNTEGIFGPVPLITLQTVFYAIASTATGSFSADSYGI